MKLYQASSFKIYVFRASVLTSLTYHTIVSVLNPILGRSSRKPPDPPSPRVGPIRNWAPIVSWLKWSIRMSIEASSFKIYVFKEFRFLTSLTYHTTVSIFNPIVLLPKSLTSNGCKRKWHHGPSNSEKNGQHFAVFYTQRNGPTNSSQ